MSQLFAYRLKNARKMSGLTLQHIALHLGISKQMVSKYENGLSMPDSPNLIKLAELLGEKIDYFFRPVQFNLENVNFRKKAAYSASKIDALKAKVLKQTENYLIIEDILTIPTGFKNPLAKFTINSNNDAEAAAEKLRNDWNIGTDAIHNIILLLENNEIKVIEYNEPDQKQFDGLSAFIDNKYPVVVINKNFSIERKRFTLLHELGHLLLNIGTSDEKEIEKLCNRFAGALLIPKSVLFKEAGNHRNAVSLPELVTLQKQFGISISALVYRLADLEIITKNRCAGFFMQRNMKPEFKQFTDESRFAGNESSDRFVQLVYKGLSQEMISISKAAALLNKSIEEIETEFSII